MAQSIRVKALKFVTPFFDYDLLEHESRYCRTVKEKYGIDVELIDISRDYINLLGDPPHGFGRYFNPCIDCKILMLSKAKELLMERKGDFLITGEVLGQRPMSQRRDTLQVIERDSSCRDLLLRPLSAKRLNPSQAEIKGLVDRERLYGITGRGRQPQIDLARKFGIRDYPNPAGGCILADPNLSKRVEKLYQGDFPIVGEKIGVTDIRFLLFGRHFLLPEKYWFILGRNQAENEKIDSLRQPQDWLFTLKERPGPTGILRGVTALPIESAEKEKICHFAAALVVRFSKKIVGKTIQDIMEIDTGTEKFTVGTTALDDSQFHRWQV